VSGSKGGKQDAHLQSALWRCAQQESLGGLCLPLNVLGGAPAAPGGLTGCQGTSGSEVCCAVSSSVSAAAAAALSQAKTRELKQNLNNEFRSIHELCMFVLANTRKVELLRATLTALAAYLSWIPPGVCFRKMGAGPALGTGDRTCVQPAQQQQQRQQPACPLCLQPPGFVCLPGLTWRALWLSLLCCCCRLHL
jgi:hypothetical protein